MIRVAVANSKRMRRAANLAAVHQAASSGKRFVNFTLVRGSAIMGATASRQVW